jgi:competence protein ComEC
MGGAGAAAGYPDFRRRNVGVRGGDGRLHVMRTGKDGFLVKEWLAADADGRTAADASLAEGVSCDDSCCVAQAADAGSVALAQRAEALTDDCDRAALIVTAKPPPAGCAASVIGIERLRRHGALALRRSRGGSFVVDAAKPSGIDRPWSPAAAGDGEPETAIPAPRAGPPRTVDATPSEADVQAED